MGMGSTTDDLISYITFMLDFIDFHIIIMKTKITYCMPQQWNNPK